MATRVDINVPRSVWTEKDTRALAQNVLASIKLRTSRGIDANGEPFQEYSTKPIYIQKQGAKLKPKGGRPSKSGKSVYYEGGYQEYKEQSRRRQQQPTTKSGAGQSAEVDLVLSGALMNNFVVLEATATSFKLGLTKHVQHYGYEVNEYRPFIGLTDEEVDILVEAIEHDIKDKLK